MITSTELNDSTQKNYCSVFILKGKDGRACALCITEGKLRQNEAQMEMSKLTSEISQQVLPKIDISLNIIPVYLSQLTLIQSFAAM